MSNTVLIVGEDVNARIIAETLLRLRGLDVCVTADTAEAGAIVEKKDIGVVVLDLSAGMHGGFEVLRRLRGRAKALPMVTEPRIVVVTDRQEPEVERCAQRLGADAFLRKPLEPGQFIATVERLMAEPPQRAINAAVHYQGAPNAAQRRPVL